MKGLFDAIKTRSRIEWLPCLVRVNTTAEGTAVPEEEDNPLEQKRQLDALADSGMPEEQTMEQTTLPTALQDSQAVDSHELSTLHLHHQLMSLLHILGIISNQEHWPENSIQGVNTSAQTGTISHTITMCFVHSYIPSSGMWYHELYTYVRL